MKYTIISLNDDRKPYKDVIRSRVKYEEITMPAVDARQATAEDLAHAYEVRDLFRNGWGNAKNGELGVWLSNFDRWELAAEDGPLIVFEDDAIPDEYFTDKFETMMAELPDDWDFAALWVPENQRQDYLYNFIYNEIDGMPQLLGYLTPDTSNYRLPGASYAALAYQGYGMVSLVYSKKGGKALAERAQATGITGPVDCWIYEQAKLGNLRGFAPRPECADIVHYDWAAVSHVQLTEMAQ